MLQMESTLSESYPKATWFGEKVFGSFLIFVLFWLLRGCWRRLRANQRLALADFDGHVRHSEQRGLLLPVQDNRNFRGGGRVAY